MTNAVTETKDREQEITESGRRIALAQEQLRKEVAAQLHGRVQGLLVVASLRLGQVLNRLDHQTLDSDLASLVQEAKAIVDDVNLKEVRQICRQLHPPVIRAGLAAALQSLADRLPNSIRYNIDIDPAVAPLCKPVRPRLADNVTLSAYRVVEEALLNVVKHAGATRVELSVAMEPTQQLKVTVYDNGRGFSLQNAGEAFGTRLMRDYCLTLGGGFTATSYPGHGCRIEALLPLIVIAPDAGDQDTALDTAAGAG